MHKPRPDFVLYHTYRDRSSLEALTYAKYNYNYTKYDLTKLAWPVLADVHINLLTSLTH